MNCFKLFAAIFFVVLISSSCEEVGPYINMSPPKSIDTTYISNTSDVPQTKMILIEDFTGVRCPNCPNAAQKIEDLQALNPGRILATAIHFNNIFGIPHSGSQDDFRTAAGKQIYDMLPGMHGALPIGDVDRTRHIDGQGNFSVLQSYSSWSSYVNEQILKPTPVNIYITPTIKDTIMQVKIKIHYTQSTTDTQALTIYLIEDNIVDWQTLPTTAIDSYYVHKHILRTVITGFNGDDLNASLVVNRVFEKIYFVNLNPKWVKSNCSIIAFVHKKGYYYDIIHAQQKHLL